MTEAAALCLPARRRAGHRMTAFIVGAALFMEQLDGTVLSTALPDMAKSFHLPPLQMSVALTAYLLSLAVFIPASGHVADRFGSRTVFCTAIALFSVGSGLCALSNSLAMLVLSRILQGIGGAMMVPVGRLILLRAVPRQQLISVMSWMLVPGQIGPVLGPPLGGFFVTTLSWRWIFIINLPIGLAGLVVAFRVIENTRGAPGRGFDWLGFLLAGLSLVMLLLGFEIASRGTASLTFVAAIVATGLVSGLLYLRHAWRTPRPILNPRLMRLRSFRISVIGGSLTRITAGALPFLLPMTIQLGLGRSAWQSGLITFASAAGAVLMKAAAAPILRRFGYRSTLMWNCVIATTAIMALALLTPAWPLWLLYAVIFAGGFFQSLQFTAFNTVAYADVAAARISSATSFYTTFQQLMLSAGICAGAAALAVALHLHHHSTPTLADFSIAWLSVGLITLLAVPVCARLAPGTGDEMAGRA